jgi:hypothetical protein
MPPQKVVKQYRIHLQLTDRIYEGTGADLGTLKEDCNRMFTGGGVKFESPPGGNAQPGQGLTLIYHPSFDGGKTALGWISPFDVPEQMSARAMIEQRLQAAA